MTDHIHIQREGRQDGQNQGGSYVEPLSRVCKRTLTQYLTLQDR
jgi:hypothetical protein